MLPGIRILFAIILLSVSVLIFGLGAAAYLRSAHEHFANATIRPIEAPAVSRLEQPPATIAMLRVDPETAPPAPVVKAEPSSVATDTSAAPPSEKAVVAAITTAPPAEPARSADSAKAPAESAAAPTVQADTLQPARETAVVEKPPASEPAASPPAETRTTETSATPAVVAVLSPEKSDTPAKTLTEAKPAATDATPAIEEPAPATTLPVTGGDTLKTDDKVIEVPRKIAGLGDPSSPDVAPIPAKEVKIPAPRVDPAELEAQRKRAQAQKEARARAKARRLAAARARAAAQARAATQNNPFGSGNTSNTNTKAGS